MFIDRAKIFIKAGDGGNGAVSFHREKYVAAGGPDGGDGGKGGDVVFVVDKSVDTLVNFRYRYKFEAQNGQPGGSKRCSGKSGEDLIIRVPLGTIVREAASGQVMADLSSGEPAVLARGGKGGAGNQHFATATRQIPRFAKPGAKGESFEVTWGWWAFQMWENPPSFPWSAPQSRRSQTITSRPSARCWAW